MRAPVYALANRSEERARTWVQITLLIVVAALLAFVMAVPATHGPLRPQVQAERRSTDLRFALAELRAGIADYRLQHGIFPGQGRDGAERPDLFVDQLAQPSDEARDAATSRVGLKLPITTDGSVPANPINHLTSVRFLRAGEPWPPEPDGRTGWIYRPSTGEVRANALGRAFDGRARFYDQ